MQVFDGDFLASLPHYLTDAASSSKEAQTLITATRAADGIIIASPSYHGCVSGLVKNAIDYLEATADDKRRYLDGLPVGLIATSAGWQAGANTLVALRSIVHALRGWPTPYGAVVRTAASRSSGASWPEPATRVRLELIGRQVVDFARRMRPGAPAGEFFSLQ